MADQDAEKCWIDSISSGVGRHRRLGGGKYLHFCRGVLTMFLDYADSRKFVGGAAKAWLAQVK